MNAWKEQTKQQRKKLAVHDCDDMEESGNFCNNKNNNVEIERSTHDMSHAH